MVIAVTPPSRTALETIEKLSHTLDFTDHASQIIHALVHVLDQSPELRPAAMETLCRMMTQLGQRYKIFIPMVKKVHAGRRRGGEVVEGGEGGGERRRERGEGEKGGGGRRERGRGKQECEALGGELGEREGVRGGKREGRKSGERERRQGGEIGRREVDLP